MGIELSLPLLVQEARHHSPEVAAVVVPSEAGGMAFGMAWVGLPVSSGDRAPDVSRRGVDPFEGCHAGRPAPGAGADRPVVTAGMAEGGPIRQAKASVTTSASGVSRHFAPRAIPRLRKPPTGTSLALHGRPSGPRPRTASCRVHPDPACRPNARRRGGRRPSPPAPTGAFPPRAGPSPP